MKTSLLCFLLLLPLTVPGATTTHLQPLPAQFGTPLEIVSTGPELTSLSLRNPELGTESLVLDGQTCKVTTLAGEPFRPDQGAPAVPQVTRLIRIPNTGAVELLIRDAQFTVLEDYNPYPYADPATSALPLASAYKTGAWFPVQPVEISAPLIFRDMRVVAVTFYPVQVNALTREARLYSALDVDIVATGEFGANELLNPRPMSPRYAPIYRGLISNLDETELDMTAQLPGGYLILSRNNVAMNQWVDSIATWRRLSGYDVQVERRTNWSISQMRTFIRDTYNSSAIPLEYVALMGDPQSMYGVPTDPQAYDHYFALANDDDHLEDLAVGRFSCSTTSEYATATSKLHHYERSPWLEDSLWFQRGLFMASTSLQLASNETFIRWADHQFRMRTALDSNVLLTHTGSLPQDTVVQLLNQGLGLFLWRGAWIGEIDNSLPTQMQTTHRLSIAAFFACATGNFEYNTALAEAWTLAGTAANPKGGVAAIGVATAASHAAPNLTTAGGLAYSLANLHVEHLGTALNSAKAWLYRTYGVSDVALNHSSWTNLMGDPALSMWTEIPATIAATHLQSLPVGTGVVALSVLDSVTNAPIADAVAVLWKGSIGEPESYSRALTDDSGRVTMPVTMHSAGDLRLCVTKHNHKPYLFNIPCTSVAQQFTVESVFIDDNNDGGTHGNGDGILNPGETVDLIVQAHNFSTTEISETTSAALSSENPRVTVVSPVVEVPPAGVDSTVLLSTPFRVTLGSDLQHTEVLALDFTFEVDGQDSPDRVTFTVAAPDIDVVEHVLWPDFAPGVTSNLDLRILNTGAVALAPADVELQSLTPFVTVTRAGAGLGSIQPADTAWTSGDFELRADTNAFRGQRAEFLLILEDDSGFRDSACFEISIGVITEHDPTGPDAYGYYAYDQTDLEYDEHAEFLYLDISAGLGDDLELDDPGEDLPGNNYSVAIPLPFEFTYYGVGYDTITVCANGWLAFGDQAWNDCFRNYPLPGINSASNMVAAYWDDLKTSGDGQGVWSYDDFANGRLILQWKASAGGYSHDQANLDFQIVLFDPAANPSRDGSGKILFLYNDVTMNLESADWMEVSGSTVGIQDVGSVVGLQYVFRTDYAPGATVIEDSSTMLFTTDGPLSLDTNTVATPPPALPRTTVLHPNYPNPFNPTTTIRFDLAHSIHTTLTIFDLTGRTVAQLIDGPLTAGSHSVAFDGANLASGVYFYRLRAGRMHETRKMVLLK
ncbi:MAG: T9SS type A sorting domain-containing protein [bacterium]|nr:T9SS type A sorting domain-containing protein [bacterium]